MRYHVYPRLKTDIKTFLENLQHKIASCWCTRDISHFGVSFLICFYKIKKPGALEKGC